jgi:hypothetical protein
VDERIKVSRELVDSEVDKKFIGDKRRLHYAYRIKVHNLRDGQGKMVVSDQIPVARHEEIKIKLYMAEPKPTDRAGHPGVGIGPGAWKGAGHPVRFQRGAPPQPDCSRITQGIKTISNVPHVVTLLAKGAVACGRARARNSHTMI